MPEVSGRRRRPNSSDPPSVSPSDDEALAERRLARGFAIGIPAASIVGAVVTGLLASLGPALLVLAFGTLLGTIALLWASLRMLSGDAPLPVHLEVAAIRRHGLDAVLDRKMRALRALKDLEAERAIGKIDDADFLAVAAGYREEAKSVMQELDARLAPSLAHAERLAREYITRHGISADPEAPSPEPQARSPEPQARSPEPQARSPEPQAHPPEPAPHLSKVESAGAARIACKDCGASNEPDADFCKRCGAAVRATGPDNRDAHAGS